MILKKVFPFILLGVLFSCDSKTVVNPNDYNAYLETSLNTEDLHSDIQFWSDKLEKNPNQYPYLVKRANAQTSIFDTTGEIKYLIQAEDDLLKAVKITTHKNSSYLKSLAANYISQHRFKEALDLLKQAEAIGDNLSGTKKMLFDVYLELGDYILAEAYLKDIKNPSDFDYLIRLAKWEDHKGNLELAIKHMESAQDIAESSNLDQMRQWTYTNLADFYGHAGAIEKSYQNYLKALALDPHNAYAKKGIAWILYSYENNPEEALKLLNHINTYHKSPDYDLLKAEIAEYTNDLTLKSKALNNYDQAVRNAHYGDMYNAYTAMVYSDEMLLSEHAIEIAQREVNNRPTPASYDLLAWSYYKKGDLEKAISIIDDHVFEKTFEPNALYHVAEIFKAAGRTNQIIPLKAELLESSFELGPVMNGKVQQL